MKHRFTVLFLFLLCILMSSCRRADVFEHGSPITPEELASISAAVFSTEAPDPSDTDLFIETLPDAEVYPDGTVHWTAGGSVWHTDPDCYHLKRATVVYHGRADQAMLAGKDHACTACQKQASTDKGA